MNKALPRESIKDIKKHLNNVLKERDNLFPKRDLNNTKIMNNLLDEYIDYIMCNTDATFNIDKNSVNKIMRVKENPIFICGFMKSGTTLLCEILDGHKNLVVLPGDSRFLSLSKNFYTEVKDDLWIRYWLKRMINPVGQYPFWILGKEDKNYINFAKYLRYFLSIMKNNYKDRFFSVVAAYYCANPNKTRNPKYWVEKTTRNEFCLNTILNYFPNGIFIHIVRNILETVNSMKKYYRVRNSKWKFVDTLYQLKKSRCYANHYSEKYKDKYYVLKYEDIIANNIEYCNILENTLNIEKDDILTRPTINKIPAKTNSMFKNRISKGKIINYNNTIILNKIERIITKLIINF